MSFSPTKILIASFVRKLRKGYLSTYGGMKSNYAEILEWAGTMALEIISSSDALYHNVEHTILVTLVGQEILRGKHIKEGHVSCEDWLHFIIACLVHDIGYVKGVCRDDKPEENLYSTAVNGKLIRLPEGATDAALTPYHVDRGMLFVEERFGNHALIDSSRIKRFIELTRFPVPEDSDHRDVTDFPGMLRAADLIGQLSDSRYLQKIPSLFWEFEETGVNKKLGYNNPGDLRRSYPSFFWSVVHKFIQPSIKNLNVTSKGKQILANLYANVFVVEHLDGGDVVKTVKQTNTSADTTKQTPK